jgi:hypothetical protein
MIIADVLQSSSDAFDHIVWMNRPHAAPLELPLQLKGFSAEVLLVRVEGCTARYRLVGLNGIVPL